MYIEMGARGKEGTKERKISPRRTRRKERGRKEGRKERKKEKAYTEGTEIGEEKPKRGEGRLRRKGVRAHPPLKNAKDGARSST